MRPVTSFFVVLAILTSCRSQKAVQSDISLSVDSVAHSSHHRAIVVFDTLAAKMDFDFDTLNITIERPLADVPEIVKIKPVKGKILGSKEQRKLAAAHEERLDTLAYKLASADKSAEHSATTRVYDPPNATGIILFALLIIGGIAYIYFHRK